MNFPEKAQEWLDLETLEKPKPNLGSAGGRLRSRLRVRDAPTPKVSQRLAGRAWKVQATGHDADIMSRKVQRQ